MLGSKHRLCDRPHPGDLIRPASAGAVALRLANAAHASYPHTMNDLPRLLVFVLFGPGCSLVLSDAPDGGPLADAGAAISTDAGIARPSVDASVEPPADAAPLAL